MFASSLRGNLLKSSSTFITQIPNFRSPHRLLHRSSLLLHPKTTTDLQQSIRNQTKVSITLATHLLSNKFPNDNVVFSPLSIHVVLGLLAAGSKGKTLDEILGFVKANSTDELNSLYSKVLPSILADGSSNGGPRLCFANGVWVEKNLSVKPSFKEVVDTVYKAACSQVDFQNSVIEVANEVNSWAEKQTDGLINNLVHANALNNITWLIFTNAIYFQGTWLQKFDPSKTKEADFNLLNGKVIQVPFMTSAKKQWVAEYDGFKVLALPYFTGKDNHQFTLCIFLPNAKDGLQSLLKKIGSTSDFFNRHNPQHQEDVGKFLVPKFKISFEIECSGLLKDLGLVLPFSDEEGLSEMVDSTVGQSVFVSSINQKCFLEVDEEGTKAVAASAMMGLGCAMPRDKIDFVADHPFLFVILEEMSGLVVFVGQLMDPRVG